MASEEREESKRVSRAVGFAVSLVSLTVLFSTIEIAGYVWEKSTAQGDLGWTLVASRRMPPEPRGNETWPYFVLEPHSEFTWSGIPVQINSQGFRTDEASIPKPEGRFRILNVGDSVPFGWGVHQEDTYGNLLEKELQKRRQTDWIEVVTSAVPGWNVLHERNFLMADGFDYQPDLVILGITVVNDILDRRLKNDDETGLFGQLRDRTYGWPFATTQFRFLLARSQGPEAIPVLNPPRHAGAYFPLSEESPVWDEIWGLIREIREACFQRGADFMVVLFPTSLQLNSAGHPNLPQRVFSRFATSDEIDLIDLLPVYSAVCEREGPRACEGFQNHLFADVWMHPSELGHRLAADAILSRLEQADQRLTSHQSGTAQVDFTH